MNCVLCQSFARVVAAEGVVGTHSQPLRNELPSTLLGTQNRQAPSLLSVSRLSQPDTFYSRIPAGIVPHPRGPEYGPGAGQRVWAPENPAGVGEVAGLGSESSFSS